MKDLNVDSLHVSHPSEPGTEIEASNILCSWSYQSYVLPSNLSRYIIFFLHYTNYNRGVQHTCLTRSTLSWFYLKKKSMLAGNSVSSWQVQQVTFQAFCFSIASLLIYVNKAERQWVTIMGTNHKRKLIKNWTDGGLIDLYI